MKAHKYAEPILRLRPQPRSPSLLMTQIATITSTIPTSWNSVGISPKNRILAVTGITIPSFANADDRTAPFSRMHFCIRTRFPVNKNPFTIPVRTAVRLPAAKIFLSGSRINATTRQVT